MRGWEDAGEGGCQRLRFESVVEGEKVDFELSDLGYYVTMGQLDAYSDESVTLSLKEEDTFWHPCCS